MLDGLPRILRVSPWGWFALALLIGTIILKGGGTTPTDQGLAAISIAVLTIHAFRALGWQEAAGFVLICLVVTFYIENVAVRTGFPFGHYSFLVGAGLPHVGLIPIIVGPLYFGMDYASWVISCLLLNGEVERPMDAFSLISLPIIAAAIMTQWDLVMDPSASTLGKEWVWHDGGGYFGVPLSNFLGWFAVTWCVFQGFALLAYLRQDRGAYRRRSNLWLVPALLYAAAGLCYIHSLAAPSAIVTDGSGHAWSAANLRETTVIVMLFTMLRTSVLAIFRLFQRV